MFAPKKEYKYRTEKIPLKEFHDYKDKFILRPPYQRKANIWSPRLRQNFLDSLGKGYYVPKIVLREVRFGDEEIKLEVIDGQQRITTIINFYEGKTKLPESLKGIDTKNSLVGRTYDELEVKQKEWFDKALCLEADIIENIENKADPQHLKIASEIFWRLQQGEPLTFMETLHARLHSASRNFITKYADDISYDFANYELVQDNKNRHPFFSKILAMKNKRMQHLALLGRMLLIELNDGPIELSKEKLQELIDQYPLENGKIDDNSFEAKTEIKTLLKVLNSFYEIFKDDAMVKGGDGVQELKREYFILSLYLLLRHIEKFYVLKQNEQTNFKEFVKSFYQRWKNTDLDDNEINVFRDNRQQSKENIETRDMIIRSIFFKEHPKFVLKDSKRTFDEAERIRVYREGKGWCQKCLEDGKSKSEAFVPWHIFDADHIKRWTEGGETSLQNARLLCRMHNRSDVTRG